jgi:hypothetical protein
MDPFSDADYVAGCEARDSGDLNVARRRLELAAKRNNPVAVLALLDVCYDLEDPDAALAHAAHLERMAESSAECAYVAAKAYEFGPWLNFVDADEADAKRKGYLVKAAELGNPMAQLELAANYGLGLNDFAENLDDFKRWVTAAAEERPVEAARCYADVARAKGLDLPPWVERNV